MSKTNLEVHMNLWKYWENETDDEIQPVFAQFLWTLKLIFSSSLWKLFLVLFQAIPSRKCEKDFNILLHIQV